MVYKALNGTGGGDLDNAADFYGIQDDQIVILSGANTVLTWAGDDLIDSRRSAAAFGQEIYAGDGDDQVYGGAGGETVRDGDGDDYVTLGVGNDFIFADAGNDTYRGGPGTDFISFNFINVVSDTILEANTTGVVFDLAKAGPQNLGPFGVDTATGFENAIGGLGNDTLFGDGGVNILEGRDGDDVLYGRVGNDALAGEVGRDTLIGGAGKDALNLAEPMLVQDRVKFLSIAESGKTAATADTIIGFDTVSAAALSDRIDLSSIDADPTKAGNQKFAFVGGGPFTAGKRGEVGLTVVAGDTYVRVDLDKDAATEMLIVVDGVVGLNAGDFLL